MVISFPAFLPKRYDQQNTFIASDPDTFFTEHAPQLWDQLCEQNMANAVGLARYVATEWPNIVIEALQENPQFAQRFSQLQSNNADPDSLPEDFELDMTNPLHQELARYRQQNAQNAAQEQKQAAISTQEQRTANAQTIETGLVKTIDEQITQLQQKAGLTPERSKTIRNDIVGTLQDHQEFNAHRKALVKAAHSGTAAPIGVKTKMERIVNNVIAAIINRETQASITATATKQQKPGTGGVKIGGASVAARAGMNYDLNSPEFQQAAIKDVTSRFPRK